MKKQHTSHLSPEEKHIIENKGTESPFSGEYNDHFEAGIFICRACKSPLYESNTKFNSGCGWPAFYKSLPDKIEESSDKSFGMNRVEITCQKCGGHLGHVFNDGPKPTGFRYCVNSASLDFDPEEKK